MHLTSDARLRLLLLLGAAQICISLQGPIHFHDSPPTPDLLRVGGSLNGHWHPVAMSPVTSSEASEPVFDAFLPGTPVGMADRRYWGSPHLGVNEAAEWLPPEDWQLPPPALGLRELAPVDSDGGTGFDHEASTFDSQGASLFSSSAPAYQTLPPVAAYSHTGTVEHPRVKSDGTKKWRPVCNICNLKEASQASISSSSKYAEWDIFACRFCASAVSLQQKTKMYKLRGRCSRCPRYATFAPPGYPQHISLHCKAHKWPSEVSKAKRLDAAKGFLQSVDSDSHDQPRDAHLSTATSSAGFLPSLSLEDSDSTMQILWSASERMSASESALEDHATAHSLHRASQHATRALVRRCNGRGRSISVEVIPARKFSERTGAEASRGAAFASGRSRSCCGSIATSTEGCGGFAATCSEEGCIALASYGTGGVALSCKKHSRPGQVRLLAQKKGGLCSYVGGCTKRASFGDAEQGVARFCAEHKLSWHTNVRAIRCTAADCQVQSTYGPPCSRRPILCSKHRRHGDVDLRHGRRASGGVQSTASQLSSAQILRNASPATLSGEWQGRDTAGAVHETARQSTRSQGLAPRLPLSPSGASPQHPFSMQTDAAPIFANA